jgi:hypothetical protein
MVVIPAQAGIHEASRGFQDWTPAFAGVTVCFSRQAGPARGVHRGGSLMGVLRTSTLGPESEKDYNNDCCLVPVIPAQAGINEASRGFQDWTPALAKVTVCFFRISFMRSACQFLLTAYPRLPIIFFA